MFYSKEWKKMARAKVQLPLLTNQSWAQKSNLLPRGAPSNYQIFFFFVGSFIPG